MINDKASKDIRQKYLGHKSPMLTDVYKHVFSSSLESESEENSTKNSPNEITITDDQISDADVVND